MRKAFNKAICSTVPFAMIIISIAIIAIGLI